jgi:hypothetical protein
MTKFRSVVSPLLGAPRAEDLLARILAVDSQPSIRPLVAAMVK